MSLFVDTSVWYAAADRGDTSNQRAKEILSAGDPLVTTDHVLVETWLLLRHRLGRHAAERFWLGLQNGAAALEAITAADLERAWAIGEAFSDQDFSIVDRTASSSSNASASSGSPPSTTISPSSVTAPNATGRPKSFGERSGRERWTV